MHYALQQTWDSRYSQAETEMTDTELSRFKKVLESRQVELERVVRNRDGIVIEKSADALDDVQRAAERELAIRNLDRTRHC